MRYRIVFPFIVFLLLCCFHNAYSASAAIAEKKAEQPFHIDLADATGQKISLKSCPERIISLAPSITECLFDLNLDQEIVGVTIYCDRKRFPNMAKMIEDCQWDPDADVPRLKKDKADSPHALDAFLHAISKKNRPGQEVELARFY